MQQHALTKISVLISDTLSVMRFYELVVDFGFCFFWGGGGLEPVISPWCPLKRH